MALTLLVETNPIIAEIYLLNLTTYTGLEVAVTHSVKGAIELIELHQIELIISRVRIGAEDIASILTHLKTMNREIPVLIIGDGTMPKGTLGPVRGSLDLKSMIKGAAQVLGITAESMAQKKVPDYFPLSAKYFEFITIPCANVFNRDKAGNTTQIFVAFQALDRTILKAISKISDGTFYVHRLDRLKMVDQITVEMLAQLDENDLSPDEKLQVGASNHKLLAEKLLGLGVTEETVLLARKAMGSITANVKSYPQMSGLLKRMLSNKTGYLYRHMQIVTYVALHIVRNIDWGTPEQEQKISFIAFFHDISLDNDAHARIHTMEDMRKANLDPKTKEKVERHAQHASELVLRYPHSPMGADQIIRQHHGMLNGVGFSDHFGANLSPMALVFVVAEECTRIILESDIEKLNIEDMIQELKITFPSLRIHKIIDLLADLRF